MASLDESKAKLEALVAESSLIRSQLNAAAQSAQAVSQSAQAISSQSINGPLASFVMGPTGQVQQVVPGPRKARTRLPESDKFPEHKHVWTVVEIDNNPVGVTCSICDYDHSLTDEPIINLEQVITLEVGVPLRIKDAWVARNGEKGDANMRVQDFQITRTPQGVELDIRLTSI